ncbi:hypothetical protein GLOIN_2v1871152, partial [Rhizophagus irregularis DAOM 181602=DAOM 197198]
MKEGDLMPYIKEHVMKEKRVRYLAIEFESYNIKIVNFDDFYIRAYEFVNE